MPLPTIIHVEIINPILNHSHLLEFVPHAPSPGTFFACLLDTARDEISDSLGGTEVQTRSGLPRKPPEWGWIFEGVWGSRKAKEMRKVKQLLVTLLVGILVCGSTITARSETVKAPFDPEGKALMYVSFFPLITDKGELVPVTVEFYRTSAGEVVVEWNPFDTRRLQAVDLSPADPCGPIWINKALLTRGQETGWKGWILRSEPIKGDEWELEPSISPKCEKQLASIE